MHRPPAEPMTAAQGGLRNEPAPETGPAASPAQPDPGRVRSPSAGHGPQRAATRILIVEDEAELVRALRINLRARQYQVLTAGTGREALTVAASHPP
ncbi:MAG: hypothetical protein JO037_03125, partial [Actinobacteria bacterium]|nr:hypothetical protein [Actinomycetota bacterium]